ncbi:MAG: hypothetical protein AAGU27_23135 [Dehalobacterium sp.]
MNKFEQIFPLCLIFILAFVLPVAVLAGKEGKMENRENTQQMITTEEFDRNIDNETSKIDEKDAIEFDPENMVDENIVVDQKNVPIYQENILIKEKNALTSGLKEAEFRLEQLKIQYKEALLLGALTEIDRLSADIATEKSNIAVIKTLLKKTIEEMYKAEVFKTSNI